MAFMLIESPTEVMTTAARRNEEIVRRRGRREHGNQGLRAWIADGGRGQPGIAVGVVGVVAIAQHGARDAAAEALTRLDAGVDFATVRRRWVTLQHLDWTKRRVPEAVEKHARDESVLISVGSLLLHD